MKNTITLFLISCFCFLFTYHKVRAQNYYLYNTKTSKTRDINHPVRIKTSDGKARMKFKGEAVMLNDSILSINDTILHIKDILMIQAVTKESIQSGILISVGSALLFTAGTIFAIQSGSATGLGVVTKVMLSIVSYTGGVSWLYRAIENLFFGSKYRSHNGWTIKQSKGNIITPS